MSIADGLNRVLDIRNGIRSKMVALGLSENSDNFEQVKTSVENIIDNTKKTSTATAIQGTFSSGQVGAIFAKGLKGYSSEASMVKIPVANLAPENIKEGVNIAGNIGTVKETPKNSPCLLSNFKGSLYPYVAYSSVDNVLFNVLKTYKFNNNKIAISNERHGDFKENSTYYGDVVLGDTKNGITGNALISSTQVMGHSESEGILYVHETTKSVTTIDVNTGTITKNAISGSFSPSFCMALGKKACWGRLSKSYRTLYISNDNGKTWQAASFNGLPTGDVNCLGYAYSENAGYGFLAINEGGITLYKTSDFVNYTKTNGNWNNEADWSGCTLQKIKYVANDRWCIDVFYGNYYGADNIKSFVIDGNGNILKEISYDLFSYGSSSSDYDVNAYNCRFEGLYTIKDHLYIVDKEKGILFSSAEYKKPYTIAFIIGVSFDGFIYLPDEHKMILFAYGAQYAIDLPNDI